MSKIFAGLGSGLIIGAMSGNLPSFQFWCFVAGVALLNIALTRAKKI